MRINDVAGKLGFPESLAQSARTRSNAACRRHRRVRNDFSAMKNLVAIAVWGLTALLLSAQPARAADLKSLRFGPETGKTRIVFDIKGAPQYTISGDGLGNGRLFIDFTDLSIPPAALAVQPAEGHIANYQFVKSDNGGVRAVLTLKTSAKIGEYFVIEPSAKVSDHRLVIDLLRADKAAFMDSLPAQYPDLGPVIERATAEGAATAPTPAVQREVVAPPARRVIVVDAGHGGVDPGAVGQGGTLEKDVTMKAALKLKEILEKTGRYDVVLTRRSNTDLRIIRGQAKELARRETLARQANAALFISLHADALAQKDVRGGSVYTLSDKGTKRSANVAKSEGNFTVYRLDTREFKDDEYVGDILFDIAQGKTSSNSSRFAQKLLNKLDGKIELLRTSHRKADLRVLLAPDVPAVLFEMAYMSNKEDEANLNSKAWRKRTMNAVASAIDEYFAENPQQFAQTGGAGGN